MLAIDSDLDGDALTFVGIGLPANGTVTFSATDVTYSPALNFNGSDSFIYIISDGNGGTASATVFISIGAVNDAPVANDDQANVLEDGTVTVNVLGNDSDVDGDPLTVTGVGPAGNGTVTFSATDVTYTPAANFNDSDSFTYSISDGNGGTASATVSGQSSRTS